jgi:ATPase subunit of ABC transporter with duplicated ATPase domains
MHSALIARGISLSRGSNLILSDVELSVSEKQRLGLVGPNGVGKSTLLGVLAGTITPDAGVVELHPPTARVALLAQEIDRPRDEVVSGFLWRRTGLAKVQAEFDQATLDLASDQPGADDRYSTALDQWLAAGAADFESRQGEVLARLALPQTLLDLPMAALSGGQAARVGLAVVLLAQPDILLLDEPTNDLDFVGLDILEEHLTSLSIPQLIVSHDRAFLERVITGVVEIDPHHKSAAFFDGGWLAYLYERDVAARHAEERYSEFVDKRSALQDRVQQQRQWADTGAKRAKRMPSDGDKFIKARNLAQSEKLAGKAARTEKAMERLEQVDKPWEEWELKLSLAVAPRSGDIAAALDEAVVSHGDFTLGPISLSIASGERVALLGHNGSGKTTLLNAMLGAQTLTKGGRFVGPSVIVGEMMQLRSQFSGAATALRAFQDAGGPDTDAEARTLLAKFGIGREHVDRPAESLSPGERTRLVLALMQTREANFVVLDEPTNHLDMLAIEQLESALADYPGTILVVTHDRQFLDSLRIDRVIELENGQIVSDASPN